MPWRRSPAGLPTRRSAPYEYSSKVQQSPRHTAIELISHPSPPAVACPRSACEVFERLDVDLGEGREGLDRVAQNLDRNASANRQRRLLKPFARLGAERVGACQPLAVSEQGEEPVAVGVRARVRLGLRELRSRAVPLKRPSVAPTAAACGSVKTTRGTAS